MNFYLKKIEFFTLTFFINYFNKKMNILSLLDENFFEIFDFINHRELLPIIFTCKKFKELILDSNYFETPIKTPKTKQIIQNANLFFWYFTTFSLNKASNYYKLLKKSIASPQNFYLYSMKYTENRKDLFEIISFLHYSTTIPLDVTIFNYAFLIGDIELLDWMFERSFPFSQFVLFRDMNNVSFNWFTKKLSYVKTYNYWKKFIFFHDTEEKVLEKYFFCKKYLTPFLILDEIESEIIVLCLNFELRKLFLDFLSIIYIFNESKKDTFYFLVQNLILKNKLEFLILLLNKTNQLSSNHINYINDLLNLYKDVDEVVNNETYSFLIHRFISS